MGTGVLDKDFPRRTLRVLQIEDSPHDVELIHEHLLGEGIQPAIDRVETPEDVVAALQRADFDIIFCDYGLPKYDGLAALELARELCPDIPFIFVSGTIGETRAIEALKLGATDYVLKNDLRRLGTCVHRALREAKERRRRKRAEKRVASLSTLSHHLSLCTTIEEAGKILADVSYDLFNWDLCTLDMYIAERDMLRPIIDLERSNDRHMRTRPAISRPPTSYMRKIMDHGAEIVLRQPPVESSGELAEGRPTLSLMYVPVRNGRNVIAILSIQSYSPDAYSGEDLQTLQSLADHCGGALERIRGEEALRASEEQYRRFFQEDLAGAYFSTPEGKIVACNPEFARILGFASVEEALQTNPEELYVDPGARAAFLMDLKKNKKLRHHEELIRRKDGKHVHIIENVVGQFDEHDELVQLTGYIFDVSEQKLLEEQLRQSQKMEGMGTLAGGIAHDFNNLLAIILGHASLLEQEASDPDRISGASQAITQAVQRGAALVQQLLAFARKSTVAIELTNCNAVILELLAMLKATFPKTVEFETELDSSLPDILVDQNQLHQALLNLCLNARDAMSSRGVLTLKSGRVKRSDVQHPNVNMSHDEYVCLTVSDTGIGMDEKTRERIFEPFFTTKEKGKGTGLGLSVVYGAIKSVNGFVEVDSEPGCGTSFHLYLPITSGEFHSAKRGTGSMDEIRGGHETILLVEDEELLAAVTKAALESSGYNVLLAADGVEAVEQFKSGREHIDLVISDLGLPKMSGTEVIGQLRAMNPGLRCILVSGFLDAEQRDDIEKLHINRIMEKPYLPNEILQTIREVLDS